MAQDREVQGEQSETVSPATSSSSSHGAHTWAVSAHYASRRYRPDRAVTILAVSASIRYAVTVAVTLGHQIVEAIPILVDETLVLAVVLCFGQFGRSDGMWRSRRRTCSKGIMQYRQ